MRRGAMVLLLLVLIAVVALLYARWRAGEAGKIRRVVEAMRQAGEAKDQAAFMSHISGSYHDRLRMTHAQIGKLMAIVVRGPENYRARVSALKVRVKAKSAVARMRVSLSINRGKPFASNILLEFRKEDGRWLVTSSAGWQGFFEEAPASKPGAAI